MRIGSNLVAVFVFAVTAPAEHDGKYHRDCMADDADDVAYKNCNATYRYCNSLNYCNDVFDCMLGLSMLDTLDKPVELYGDIHKLNILQTNRFYINIYLFLNFNIFFNCNILFRSTFQRI